MRAYTIWLAVCGLVSALPQKHIVNDATSSSAEVHRTKKTVTNFSPKIRLDGDQSSEENLLKFINDKLHSDNFEGTGASFIVGDKNNKKYRVRIKKKPKIVIKHRKKTADDDNIHSYSRHESSRSKEDAKNYGIPRFELWEGSSAHKNTYAHGEDKTLSSDEEHKTSIEQSEVKSSSKEEHEIPDTYTEEKSVRTRDEMNDDKERNALKQRIKITSTKINYYKKRMNNGKNDASPDVSDIITYICQTLNIEPDDVRLLANTYLGLDIYKPNDFETLKYIYRKFIEYERDNPGHAKSIINSFKEWIKEKFSQSSSEETPHKTNKFVNLYTLREKYNDYIDKLKNSPKNDGDIPSIQEWLHSKHFNHSDLDLSTEISLENENISSPHDSKGMKTSKYTYSIKYVPIIKKEPPKHNLKKITTTGEELIMEESGSAEGSDIPQNEEWHEDNTSLDSIHTSRDSQELVSHSTVPKGWLNTHFNNPETQDIDLSSLEIQSTAPKGSLDVHQNSPRTQNISFKVTSRTMPKVWPDVWTENNHTSEHSTEFKTQAPKGLFNAHPKPNTHEQLLSSIDSTTDNIKWLLPSFESQGIAPKGVFDIHPKHKTQDQIISSFHGTTDNIELPEEIRINKHIAPHDKNSEVNESQIVSPEVEQNPSVSNPKPGYTTNVNPKYTHEEAIEDLDESDEKNVPQNSNNFSFPSDKYEAKTIYKFTIENKPQVTSDNVHKLKDSNEVEISHEDSTIDQQDHEFPKDSESLKIVTIDNSSPVFTDQILSDKNNHMPKGFLELTENVVESDNSKMSNVLPDIIDNLAKGSKDPQVDGFQKHPENNPQFTDEVTSEEIPKPEHIKNKNVKHKDKKFLINDWLDNKEYLLKEQDKYLPLNENKSEILGLDDIEDIASPEPSETQFLFFGSDDHDSFLYKLDKPANKKVLPYDIQIHDKSQKSQFSEASFETETDTNKIEDKTRKTLSESVTVLPTGNTSKEIFVSEVMNEDEFVNNIKEPKRKLELKSLTHKEITEVENELDDFDKNSELPEMSQPKERPLNDDVNNRIINQYIPIIEKIAISYPKKKRHAIYVHLLSKLAEKYPKLKPTIESTINQLQENYSTDNTEPWDLKTTTQRKASKSSDYKIEMPPLKFKPIVKETSLEEFIHSFETDDTPDNSIADTSVEHYFYTDDVPKIINPNFLQRLKQLHKKSKRNKYFLLVPNSILSAEDFKETVWYKFLMRQNGKADRDGQVDINILYNNVPSKLKAHKQPKVLRTNSLKSSEPQFKSPSGNLLDVLLPMTPDITYQLRDKANNIFINTLRRIANYLKHEVKVPAEKINLIIKKIKTEVTKEFKPTKCASNDFDNFMALLRLKIMNYVIKSFISV